MQVTVTFLWNKKVGGEYVDLFIASAATEEGGGVDAPLFNPSDYRFIKWSTEDYREHVFSSMTVYAQCIPTWETLSFMSQSDLYAYLFEDNNFLRESASSDLLNEVYQELTSEGYRTQSGVDIGAKAESNFSDELSSLTGLSDLDPHNPEFGAYNDEAAANSIVNVKNLEIEFNVDKFTDETKKFIQNTVMPYVKHMIPSTAILSYKIKGEEKDELYFSPAISLHGNYSDDYNTDGVKTKQIKYSLVNVNIWQDDDDWYYLYYTIDNDTLNSGHTVNIKLTNANENDYLIYFCDSDTFTLSGSTFEEQKPNSGSTGVKITNTDANNAFDIKLENPFYIYDDEISGETVTHIVSVNLYVKKNDLG